MVLIIGFALAVSGTAYGSAASAKPVSKPFPYTLYIDGERLDFAASAGPFNRNGTAYVPFRPVFERMGWNASWDQRKKQASGTGDQWTIVITAGTTRAIINGINKEMPAPAILENGVVYVPLRFVAEASGGQIQLYGGWMGAAWLLTAKQLALLDAIFQENLDAMEELLRKGADPMVGFGPVAPPIVSFVTFLKDNVEITALLLKNGLDVNAADSYNGATMLHLAVLHNRIHTVRYLLEQGADVTLDSRLGTPLEIAETNAIGEENEEMVELLTSYLEQAEESANEDEVNKI